MLTLEEAKAKKRKEIAAHALKLEGPSENTKDGRQTKKEAEKAKFLAERDLVHIEQEIKSVNDQVQVWHARIRSS